jgi:hypothetical protein
MPRGPQGQNRPADVVGCAVVVAKIATQEIKETAVTEKSADAVVRGRRGGKKGGPARAEKLPPQDRQRIAAQAARARWGEENGNAGSRGARRK